ncbi:MAG: glycoside hydrolase family 127 protein [Prolixibacteraceae bacterium]|nr:glycoside hydrolase family 127 protein [Prolixibacteraceae bacterium]
MKTDRSFADGDEIKLTLPMKISVKRWNDNKNSISANYGPLTFSLKIEDNWSKAGGTEEWPAWEIYPASPWNYGLVINETDPVSGFEVVKTDQPTSNMPFSMENAPIEIKVKARKIFGTIIFLKNLNFFENNEFKYLNTYQPCLKIRNPVS